MDALEVLLAADARTLGLRIYPPLHLESWRDYRIYGCRRDG